MTQAYRVHLVSCFSVTGTERVAVQYILHIHIILLAAIITVYSSLSVFGAHEIWQSHINVVTIRFIIWVLLVVSDGA